MKFLSQLRIILPACLFLLFVLPEKVDGQISQGGTPIHIQKLKSAVTHDLLVLPAVDNQKLQRENQQQSGLKSFRFAHPFDVSLSPANSGQWYSTPEVNVWQLRIRSTGAYSLNVIFGKYRLPENARLFIIGAAQDDIKGAYTSFNNSPSNSLAIEPVAGDEILIQYEEPAKAAFCGELEISRISHDFMGLGAARDHRPLGISGSCNVNINCDQVDGTEHIRDAVCRIIVEGTDVCTGTLVNNTANDGTPYLLTAYHCISNEIKANASVFLFNYESPACVSVDGDVSRSMSGSNLRASFDSLDFALVELREDIPFANRPYLAGWNRKNQSPTSSKSIHHPMGDIKKIATDKDPAVTGRFNNTYLVNGAWKILRWDTGVTESGSSGGPLFDQDNLLVGTLTGGSATCSVPTNDFFSKFALAWNHRRELNRQLKAWLDPVNSNAEKISGYDPNSGETLCQPITNFKNADFHDALQIREGTVRRGYYAGTNSAGFTEFAEQYTFSESCEIQGVSLGIAKAKVNLFNAESLINVRVYEGESEPVTLLHSQKFDVKNFYEGAMNYLPFSAPVKTTGSFFITFDLKEMPAGDTLAVYLARRLNDPTNSFFLKNSSGWLPYNSQNTQGNGSALLTELTACNIDSPIVIDTSDIDTEAVFYPNPLMGDADLKITTKSQITSPERVKVYDLLGRVQNISVHVKGPKELLMNLSGLRSGVYFIHITAGGRHIVGKIAYIR